MKLNLKQRLGIGKLGRYYPGKTRLTYWNRKKYSKMTGRNLFKFKAKIF